MVGGRLGSPALPLVHRAPPDLVVLGRALVRRLLRPLGLALVLQRDARWLQYHGGGAALFGSPQDPLFILRPRGGCLRDNGRVVLGPPRPRLLVGEHGWGLVDRETGQAGGGRRPGAGFPSIVGGWAWRVRGWHLAEHFRRYCGDIEQVESGRKVAASARRITRVVAQSCCGDADTRRAASSRAGISGTIRRVRRALSRVVVRITFKKF